MSISSNALKYTLIVGVLLLLGKATSIQWRTSWKLKTECFKKENISLQKFLILDNNVKWSDSEREGIPKPLWRVPSLESTITDEYLMEEGFSGYLLNTSSSLEAIALDKETRIHVTGELLLHRYGLIDRVFDNTEVVVGVPVIVAGKKYLTYDFLLTESRQKIVNSSSCLRE